jgi:hypothetical protein
MLYAMTQGTAMEPKFRHLLLILIPFVAVFFGCEDECKHSIHFHNFYDQMWIETELDTIHLFIAAEHQPPLNAPVTYTVTNSDDYGDSLMVFMLVYGMSYDYSPDPNKAIFWHSDSVYVWYSSYPFNPDRFCPQSDRGLLGTSYPDPYYVIDHIFITVPTDKFVYTHGQVVMRCF